MVSRFLPQILAEQIGEKNRRHSQKAPLTLFVASTAEDADCIVQDSAFDILKQTETSRVAVLEIPTNGTLKSTLKEFKAEYGEINTLFLLGHGLEDSIFLGAQIYSIAEIKPDDFDDTNFRATIVFSCCLAGKKLVPAIASRQPENSERRFLAFTYKISTLTAAFFNCPHHGLECIGLDRKMRQSGRIFSQKKELMPCKAQPDHPIFREMFTYFSSANLSFPTPGEYHFHGLGIEQSYERALEFFLRSKMGHMEAIVLYVKTCQSMLLASMLPQNSTYDQRRVAYSQIIYDWRNETCDFLSSQEKKEEFQKRFKKRREELLHLIKNKTKIEDLNLYNGDLFKNSPHSLSEILKELKTLEYDPKDFVSIVFFELAQYVDATSSGVIDNNKALKNYGKAAKLGLTEAYHGLGLLQAKLGKYKEAYESFSRSKLPESKEEIEKLSHCLPPGTIPESK